MLREGGQVEGVGVWEGELARVQEVQVRDENVLCLCIFVEASVSHELANHWQIDAASFFIALHLEVFGHGGPHLPEHLHLVLLLLFLMLLLLSWHSGCLILDHNLDSVNVSLASLEEDYSLGVPRLLDAEFEQV